MKPEIASLSGVKLTLMHTRVRILLHNVVIVKYKLMEFVKIRNTIRFSKKEG